MTDWVKCPICREPDMRCEPSGEGKIINCVNLGCASNGGGSGRERCALIAENYPIVAPATASADRVGAPEVTDEMIQAASAAMWDIALRLDIVCLDEMNDEVFKAILTAAQRVARCNL